MTARRKRPAALAKPLLTLERYRKVTDLHDDTAVAAYRGILAYADDVRRYEAATGERVPWNDQDPNAFAGEVAADRGEETPEAPRPKRAARRRKRPEGEK